MSQSNFHRHHRKLRSQGGSGAWGNMIELPVAIHQMVHENPEVAYQHGLLVKSHDDPNQIRPDVRGFLASLGFEGDIGFKPKRKNFEKGSQERRQRKRITVAVPADRENGGEVWDEILELVKAKLVRLGLYSEDDKIPQYEALIAALYDWAVLSEICGRDA